MPENSIPGGPPVLPLLILFAVGGALGIIYTTVKEDTVKENSVPLIGSVAVVTGFAITVLENTSNTPLAILIGVVSIAVYITGFERRESDGAH
ncbi:hypothetical protein [Halococcus sp. IIIV-5B]|uniref:hypothetical protein n=1 Tax=Halococcus sp. IIIV-5B TaxID=2321230 RepID=UPI0011C47E6D|nr:hypothetical protein [Halococcus sp. IIIV-5B]